MPTQVVSAETRQIARYVFITCRSVKFYVPHRRKNFQSSGGKRKNALHAPNVEQICGTAGSSSLSHFCTG